MLMSFKLCVLLLLLWFFTIKKYLANMKSNSFSFWLSQLCPVLRKSLSLWLFFHIHKLLHTPTQENYHQALIWLNFNGRLPLSATELIPLFFIATTCITYKSVFFSYLFKRDILKQEGITLYLIWRNQLWQFLGKTAVFVIIYSHS